MWQSFTQTWHIKHYLTNSYADALPNIKRYFLIRLLTYNFPLSFKTARLIEGKGYPNPPVRKGTQYMSQTETFMCGRPLCIVSHHNLRQQIKITYQLTALTLKKNNTTHNMSAKDDDVIHMWMEKHHSEEYLCILCIYSQSQCKFGKLMFKLTSIFPPLSLSGSSTYSSFTL